MISDRVRLLKHRTHLSPDEPTAKGCGRAPLWNPALRTYRLPTPWVPSFIISLTDRADSHPCSSGPRSASMPRVLPSFFTRRLKCAFNIKVKTIVLILMLSAIRNITDKDDGPSEPPWTAAKSALEQDATRAGSMRPMAAGGDCE